MKLSIKKLFESFFQPEMPSQANRHQQRSSYHNETGPDFPYVNPKADLEFQEEPALGISGTSMEEIEEGAMFDFTVEPGTPLTNVADINFSKLKGGADPRRMNKSDLQPTLSVMDFFENSDENQDRIDAKDAREETKVRVSEAVGERNKMPSDLVVTKQPFKNGMPTEDQPWDPETHLDKEEKIIDQYIKNEGYATDDFESMVGTKKIKGPKSDMHFMEDMEGDQPFLQISLKDFEDANEK